MATREKPKPVWCGERVEHGPHTDLEFPCKGWTSPKKKSEYERYQQKSPDDVEDLNKIWVPITELRMELAKMTKEGYEQYPLGELMLKIREIIRRNDGPET